MSKQRNLKAKGEPLRSSRRAPVVEPLLEPANFWIIGFFVLLTIVFWWGHLTGSSFLWEDFTEAYYPFQSFAARSFSSGVIPFWNPFTFNGMPFLADLQNGVFYPGNQLMYWLSGGHLSAWLAQFFIIIHYLVAMLGMWRLARAFGISQWGSVFASVVYALSGFMVAHAMHHNMVYHQAWFPVIVLLFYKAITRRSWLYSFGAGLTLGLVLLSGHPQLALYIIFFLFCLTLFLLVADLRSDEPARRSTVLKGAMIAAVPVVIGLGIFAIQLMPAMELAKLSERAEMPYEKSLEGALGPGQLLTLVVPKLFGVAGPAATPDNAFWYAPGQYYYWETAIYFGVVTLLLAAIGLASRRMGGLGWFLAAMGIFGLLYGLGDSFFIHPIFGRLPGFNTFRIPTRMAVYLALGGSLLAGLGLDRLLRRDEDADRLSRVTLVAGGIIVLIGLLSVTGTVLIFLTVPPEAQAIAPKTAATGITALLIGGAAAVLAWMRLKGRVPATATAVAMIALGVIDMFIFGGGQNSSPENPQKEVFQQADDQFAAFKAEPPGKIFRVKMREGGAMLMHRNQGPYSGIMLYDGYNPLLLQRRIPPAATPDIAYDLLNIRYDVRIDSAQGSMGLAERPHPYPHVRMLYDARVADSAGTRELLKTVDPGKTVVLQEDPGVKLDGTGSGTATISAYSASQIVTQVTTDKPGVLVMSEIWYPAWHVYIDGAPARLLMADYSLRGVAVPAGTHTVTMRFESDAFRTGTWITIAALVAGVAGLLLSWMKRRSAKPVDAPKVEEPAPVG